MTASEALEQQAPEFHNRIVLSWRPEAQAFFRNRSSTRPVSAGETLYREGECFTHAVFPHAGVISLMSNTQSGRAIEKASIGHEGFVGLALIMGGGPSISNSTMLVPGHVSFLSIEDLDEAMERFFCVRTSMIRYAKCLIYQLMETVACNSLHSAEQRISRWLLHASDRVGGDSFQITHEALSQALGLRRATVSTAYAQLMRSGCISYSRGALTLLDRDALHERACECYRNVCDVFADAEKTPPYELPPL